MLLVLKQAERTLGNHLGSLAIAGVTTAHLREQLSAIGRGGHDVVFEPGLGTQRGGAPSPCLGIFPSFRSLFRTFHMSGVARCACADCAAFLAAFSSFAHPASPKVKLDQ